MKFKNLIEKLEKFKPLNSFNNHLGLTPKDVHAKIHSENKHYEKASSDPHVGHTLYQYGKSSNALNNNLYQNKPLNDEQKTHLKNLDKVTNKKTKTEHHVFSGTGFDVGDHLKNSKDNVLHLKAFTSTSVNPEIARSFSYPIKDEHSDILHIHVKPGDKIHHMALGQTKFDHEHEAILPRNTKLKVNPTPDVHKHHTGIYRIYHATIHSQE